MYRNNSTNYLADRSSSFIKKSIILIAIIGCLSVFAFGCSQRAYSQEINPEAPFLSDTDFLLNTIVTIQIYDKQEQLLLDGCFDLIEKYESLYSRTASNSELYTLNQNNNTNKLSQENSFTISSELFNILSKGLYYSNLSEGAFDITIAPITELWDFQTEPHRLPDQDTLQKNLQLVNYKNISLKGNQITYAKPGVRIDLGAIAKGYIADRVKDYLLANGVRKALINLGGNILCIGSKSDGSPFQIGIQKPYADRNETIAFMEIKDRSVVNSGVYERFFVLDGVHYHHILSPLTGYPYQNKLTSVTIISNKSVDGDGLSTSCFALGLEEGKKLIESLPDTYAVFITEDNQITYTKGFFEAIPTKASN
jgi:thiamine biosynthesis lipoprotein